MLLEELREKEVELVICTKGLVGTVRKCLEEVELNAYFAEVYGNIGDRYGETEYDLMVNKSDPEIVRFLGAVSSAGWRSKSSLIALLMEQRGLKHSEACLVEDDEDEIWKADPVCRTIFVADRAGMTAEHFETLRRYTGTG